MSRHGWHRSEPMHPSAGVRGWVRRFWVTMNDEEWAEFRLNADRDCLPIAVILRRMALDYNRICREHYREMSEEESAAVGGDPKD